jgi:hypothetical protein
MRPANSPYLINLVQSVSWSVHDFFPDDVLLALAERLEDLVCAEKFMTTFYLPPPKVYRLLNKAKSLRSFSSAVHSPLVESLSLLDFSHVRSPALSRLRSLTDDRVLTPDERLVRDKILSALPAEKVLSRAQADFERLDAIEEKHELERQKEENLRLAALVAQHSLVSETETDLRAGGDAVPRDKTRDDES